MVTVKLSVPYQKPTGPGSPRGATPGRFSPRPPAAARAGAFPAAAIPSTSAATPTVVTRPRGLMVRRHLFIRMPPVSLVIPGLAGMTRLHSLARHALSRRAAALVIKDGQTGQMVVANFGRGRTGNPGGVASRAGGPRSAPGRAA